MTAAHRKRAYRQNAPVDAGVAYGRALRKLREEPIRR